MNTDNYLSLAEAARTVPGKPSPATLWRWITRGCNGVKLAAVRFGDRYFVTPEALEDFGREAASAPKAGRTSQGHGDPPSRTDAARRRDVERAKRACDAAGISANGCG